MSSMSRPSTMDFFELQKENRRRSQYCYYTFQLIYFIPFFLGLISMGAVSIFLFSFLSMPHASEDPIFVLIITATGIGYPLVMICFIVAYINHYINARNIDGRQVAKKIGAVRLRRPTDDLAEIICLNVMEELAVAACLRCPALYVMREEKGLNVFTVGSLGGGKVVVLSRGLIENLSRDELQAVLAHELSHIINDDLRRNMTLAVLAGEMWAKSQILDDNEAGEQFVLKRVFPIVYDLILLGFYHWGRLVQSSYCHQREYLADAMAISLTRAPHALYTALSKINQPGASAILAKEAEMVNFLFIADHRETRTNFSVHPTIRSRLSRIMPGGRRPDLDQSLLQWRQGFRRKIYSGSTILDLQKTGRVLSKIPPAVRIAVEHSANAFCLAAGLFLSLDKAQATRQFKIITATAGLSVAVDAKAYHQHLSQIKDFDLRLPLLDLMVPALRSLSPEKKALLRKLVKALIVADEQVDLFELAAFQVLAQILTKDKNRPRPTQTQKAKATEALLSAVVMAGEPADAEEVFRAAARSLPNGRALTFRPGPIKVGLMNKALKILAGASLNYRINTLRAVITAARNDGELNQTEYELARATAAALSLAMPL